MLAHLLAFKHGSLRHMFHIVLGMCIQFEMNACPWLHSHITKFGVEFVVGFERSCAVSVETRSVNANPSHVEHSNAAAN